MTFMNHLHLFLLLCLAVYFVHPDCSNTDGVVNVLPSGDCMFYICFNFLIFFFLNLFLFSLLSATVDNDNFKNALINIGNGIFI
jgi:hypothetical protein